MILLALYTSVDALNLIDEYAFCRPNYAMYCRAKLLNNNIIIAVLLWWHMQDFKPGFSPVIPDEMVFKGDAISIQSTITPLEKIESAFVLTDVSTATSQTQKLSQPKDYRQLGWFTEKHLLSVYLFLAVCISLMFQTCHNHIILVGKGSTTRKPCLLLIILLEERMADDITYQLYYCANGTVIRYMYPGFGTLSYIIILRLNL